MENITNEVWKQIPGYEGLYDVSNFGRVRSYRRARNKIKEPFIRKFNTNKQGYFMVNLYKDGKEKYILVSRLVLLAFRGLPPPLCEASHLDGNKINNYLENLIWETHSENMHRTAEHGTSNIGEKNPMFKLFNSDVDYIRSCKESAMELAKKYNVSWSLIYAIRRGDMR